MIVGTTIRLHSAGRATHRLADPLVTVGLTEQLREELGTSWYACITYANGNQVLRGLALTSPAPDDHVCDVMRETAAKLNREAHHHGCWIVAWHADRLVYLWRDWDGDLAIMVQIDEPWTRIRSWSTEEYCERAVSALEQFRDTLRAVDLKPEHTVLKAQGQRPTTH